MLQNGGASEQLGLTITIDKGGLDDLRIQFKDQVDMARSQSPYVGDDSALKARKTAELDGLVDRYLELPGELFISEGDTYVFGENGSGNSTLARAIAVAVHFRKRVNTLESEGRQDAEAYMRDALYVHPHNRWASRFERHVDAYLNWYHDHGLAPYFAQFLDVRLPEGADDLGSFKVVDVSRTTLPSAVGKSLDLFHGRSREDLTGIVDGRSHRQGLDHALRLWSRSYGDPSPDKIICMVIDEPEMGMSPWRHQNIAAEIDTLRANTKKSALVTIIPTNSLALYTRRSDAHYINLENPELGVQTPV